MTALNRRADWPEALEAYFAAVAERPFAWGVHDCGLHVAAAVEAMTGIDLAAGFRGRYSDARSARHVFGRNFDALVDTFDAVTGTRLATVALAQRGDVVMTDNGRSAFGMTAGVVDLSGAQVACAGPHGLVLHGLIPTENWQLAWRIG